MTATGSNPFRNSLPHLFLKVNPDNGPMTCSVASPSIFDLCLVIYHLRDFLKVVGLMYAKRGWNGFAEQAAWLQQQVRGALPLRTPQNYACQPSCSCSQVISLGAQHGRPGGDLHSSMTSCAAGKGGGSFGARWLPLRTWPSFGSDVLNDQIQLFHLLNGSAAVFCTISPLS